MPVSLTPSWFIDSPKVRVTSLTHQERRQDSTMRKTLLMSGLFSATSVRRHLTSESGVLKVRFWTFEHCFCCFFCCFFCCCKFLIEFRERHPWVQVVHEVFMASVVADGINLMIRCHMSTYTGWPRYHHDSELHSPTMSISSGTI